MKIKNATLVEVMIAEEDYKHNLWDTLTCEELAECLKDSQSNDKPYIWREDWIVSPDWPWVQDWEVHQLMNRTTRVVKW